MNIDDNISNYFTSGYIGKCTTGTYKIVVNFREFGQKISLAIQNQVGDRFYIKHSTAFADNYYCYDIVISIAAQEEVIGELTS